ncbi:Transcription factor spt8 [Geranomyces michiganensis]|nr:Transcription factor spt8 [Geranomyces michiganensis]
MWQQDIPPDQLSNIDAAGSDEEDAEGSDDVGESEDAEGSDADDDDDATGGAGASIADPGVPLKLESGGHGSDQGLDAPALHSALASLQADSQAEALEDMSVDVDDEGLEGGYPEGSEFCSDLPMTMQPGVENCATYELTPMASLVHPTSVNCLASTKNMRWVFSGGEDGFIRKFDFVATLNGEQTLTQTQKHGLADSVEKGGVLSSVWENEEFANDYDPSSLPPLDPENPPSLAQDWSPVYSLDVQSEGVWCVSGCKSGNINLWSVRHDEGHCQHVLRYHKNAVSCLRITPGERGLISGSWDRSLVRWDLDVGKISMRFQGVRSQITSMSFSPSSASTYFNFSDSSNPRSSVAALDPAHIPLFRSNTYHAADDSLLMVTSYDGAVLIYDQRTANGSGRKFTAKQSDAPPWCLSACWSPNGDRVFCGRRNATIDEYDIREGRWARSLRLPRDSGPVTLVAALPNSRSLLCASQDILRLWDLDTSANDGDVVMPPSNTAAQETFLASDAGSNSAGHSPAHPAGSAQGEGFAEGASAGGQAVPQNGTSGLPNGAHLRATPQSRVDRLRQEDGVHTTASSPNGTPRLPTAGLSLFLDEEMQMGQDSVLGDQLSIAADDEEEHSVAVNGIEMSAPVSDNTIAMDVDEPITAPPSAEGSSAGSPRATNHHRSSSHHQPAAPLRRNNSLAAQATGPISRRSTQVNGIGATANRGVAGSGNPSRHGATGAGTNPQVNGTRPFSKEEEFETPPLVPFTVVPGHTTGIVTTILMDVSARFLITASGTRGWEGLPSHLCLVNALTPVINVPPPAVVPSPEEEG